MPAYHSRFNEEIGAKEACSCMICPVKTEFRGPAIILAPDPDQEDIIDEALNFFRANVLFRNFDVRGGADRTLIYVTLYIQQCLVKCEKFDDKASASRELTNLANKAFLLPGDANWPLGALFPKASTTEEGELFKTYFKQVRAETGVRLLERLYNSDGTKNKWWQAFSKRKFMGKELKD